MPGQNRKATAALFNAQHLPHRFHPCLGFSSREQREEYLKADLRSQRRACTGKNECSTLAHVTSVALTLFINSSVCPPEHDRCLQGEPYGLSGVFLRFHPLPQLEAVNSSSKIHRESYARPRVSTRCEMSFNWKPFVCRG